MRTFKYSRSLLTGTASLAPRPLMPQTERSMSIGVGSGYGQPGTQKMWPGSRRAPGTPLDAVQAERCLTAIADDPGGEAGGEEAP